MRKNNKYYIRKAHRYLGVFIGIQFLLWTLGGLYFSWNNMEEVRGEIYRAETSPLQFDGTLASPDSLLNELTQSGDIMSFQLISILGEPVYQIMIAHGHHHEYQLYDAKTATRRPELSKEEAMAMANEAFLPEATIKSVERLEAGDVSKHHEYRNGPLPAWKVSFEHASNTNVYIAASKGTVDRFRNSVWRNFDFLWMLHVMDFEGRDHIGNWLLRIFSVLGLLTVSSGFILFFSTSSGSLAKAQRRSR